MPLLLLAAGWVAGIWYASRWDSPHLLYLAVGCAALAGMLLGRRDRSLVLGGVVLLAMALGAWRMDRALAGGLVAFEGGGEVSVEGVVAAQRGRGVYLVRAQRPAEGTVLLYTGRGSKLRPGDLLLVSGEALPDARQEVWERGLARSTGAALVFRRPHVDLLDTGKAGRLATALWETRRRVSLLLERHVPRRYSPVAEGLLLGGSLRLDPEIKEDFRRTGISHILAASGYNITVLAWMLLLVLKPLLGARRALPPVLLALLVYAGLAGFSASVVRAALMGAVTFVGTWLGRPGDSGRALAAAALLMTALHPHAAFDIGAQLSFVATAGLIWLLPPIVRALRPVLRMKVLAEAVGVALTAQLSTLPLGLYYFGGLSAWALVANVIVAPLVPVGMLLSGLVLLTGSVWYPAGEACGVVAGWALGATVGVAEAVSDLPGSGIQTDTVPLPAVVLYYAAVLLALWLPYRSLHGVSVVAERAKG